MARLKTYRAKRDFSKTSEPRGAARGPKGDQFVIQKHDATRLHYDLRLELDGVMLSWAVTRGPSLVPGDKRLAIHVEDHPIEYNAFEGKIPDEEYGGGTVMIWDRGHWKPDHDPHKGMKKGHLDFELEGDKLKGHWHLVRMHKRPGERQEPWLLIKSDDDFARTTSDKDILEQKPKSVATGRTMNQIASGKSKVWHSNRPASEQSSRLVAAKTTAKPTVKTKAKPSSARAPGRKKKAVKKTKPSASADDHAAVPGAKKAGLPGFVPPCLATLSTEAPASAGWIHEIKFDGYRIQARLAGGKVTLKTRTGLDWTHKFPAVAKACAALADHDAIIDGEIVSNNADGVSDFSALQDDLKSDHQDRLAYYAFDLLHLDGFDLTGAPLIERRRALEHLFGNLPKQNVIHFSENFDANGPTLLQHACQMNLEGVLSKRSDAPYRSGRSADWLKTKCSNSQEFVVCGFGPSDVSPKRVRALVLGYYDKATLCYAGRVGTGFSDKMRDDFWHRLEPKRIDKCPFGAVPEEERGRPVHWVEPRMVIEADFRGWTGSGHLRQASFKGIREDKPPHQVVREVRQMPSAIEEKSKRTGARKAEPKKTKTQTKTLPKAVRKTVSKQAIAVAGVTLTHPERIYWEDADVSKEALARYYEQVWDWMKPHVVGRVLSLVRCPDGASGQCFYQKHASAGVDEKRLHIVPEPDGEKSISISDLSGLVALVQAGVLEVHVRGSTIDSLEEADRLVFDLDPGPGIEWKDIIAAARDVRARLRDLKLDSFVKTTGGKGLHVVLPIRPAPWDDAKDFCRRFAEQMAANQPERYTATIKKTARSNRIFVDYLRNSREATAVAPFSTRARPGATVSAPLSWEELASQKSPNHFSALNLPKRLSRMRNDPWAEIGRLKQSLPRIRKGK